MNTNIDELQSVFDKKIPITQSIKIKVKEFNNNQLELFAPLKENINHVNTAFGGSLYNLAVLTGWSMVYMIQQENNLDGNILIFDSSISYPKPINTDMKAVCDVSLQLEEIKRFVKTYNRKKLSRITLKVNIFDNNSNCGAVFEGTYVLTANNN